ncbi:putative F-box domain-containing protein 1 [Homarus americanus]|uniref:Putative F-box domain-containing protein 1 n=1 Tax=Homarus americanus TaxID=6706 RepID=A0A8J5K537_HOMAM|nr:putative F-box domain-containing protein 1 [Homarus americanus]
MSNISFDQLSDCVWLRIMSHCRAQDLAALSSTSSRLHQLANDKYLWKHFLRRDFNIVQPDLGTVESVKKLYTNLFYKYGCVLGMYETQINPCGAFLEIRRKGVVIQNCSAPSEHMEALGDQFDDDMDLIEQQRRMTMYLGSTIGTFPRLVTGDENVFAGKITVKINLKFPLLPTKEDQKSFNALLNYEPTMIKEAAFLTSEQAFLPPEDCFIDAEIPLPVSWVRADRIFDVYETTFHASSRCSVQR